jgi:hypothetical protein
VQKLPQRLPAAAVIEIERAVRIDQQPALVELCCQRKWKVGHCRDQFGGEGSTRCRFLAPGEKQPRPVAAAGLPLDLRPGAAPRPPFRRGPGKSLRQQQRWCRGCSGKRKRDKAAAAHRSVAHVPLAKTEIAHHGRGRAQWNLEGIEHFTGGGCLEQQARSRRRRRRSEFEAIGLCEAAHAPPSGRDRHPPAQRKPRRDRGAHEYCREHAGIEQRRPIFRQQQRRHGCEQKEAGAEQRQPEQHCRHQPHQTRARRAVAIGNGADGTEMAQRSVRLER